MTRRWHTIVNTILQPPARFVSDDDDTLMLSLQRLGQSLLPHYPGCVRRFSRPPTYVKPSLYLRPSRLSKGKSANDNTSSSQNSTTEDRSASGEPLAADHNSATEPSTWNTVEAPTNLKSCADIEGSTSMNSSTTEPSTVHALSTNSERTPSVEPSSSSEPSAPVKPATSTRPSTSVNSPTKPKPATSFKFKPSTYIKSRLAPTPRPRRIPRSPRPSTISLPSPSQQKSTTGPKVPRLSTLSPAKLTATDYIDISNHCRPSADLPTGRISLWYGGQKPFPPDTKGFLYFHKSDDPLFGSLRFRVVADSDPALFENGTDLFQESRGRPWEVPLLYLKHQPRFASVYETLRLEGLVPDDVDVRASAMGELIEEVQRRHVKQVLPSITSEFYMDVRKDTLNLLVGVDEGVRRLSHQFWTLRRRRVPKNWSGAFIFPWCRLSC